MNYQVWNKEEFDESYKKIDCADLEAARREIDAAVRLGKEPTLTVEVPYTLSIKIEAVGTEKPQRKAAIKESDTKSKEAAKSEVGQGETGSD